ncbi:hypothetical protein [Streptomyces sp. NPDC049813]|uniref:hypothetical protein n=1 Tax=Streptomyces sp. NPDC049813 TaxID=3365597 RepID=UPI00378B80F6
MPQTVPGRLSHGCRIKKSDAEAIADSITSSFSPTAQREFTIVRRGNTYTQSSLAVAWNAARKPGATDNLRIDVSEGDKSADFVLDKSGVRWSATGDGHFPAGLTADVGNLLGDVTEARHARFSSLVARSSPWALLVEVLAAVSLWFAWPSHRTLVAALATFSLAATAGLRWYGQWQLKSSVTFDPGAWTPWNRADRISAILLVVTIASLIVSIVALFRGGDAEDDKNNGPHPSASPTHSPSETSRSSESAKKPHISVRGNCTEETMNSPLSVISGGFTPGQPYTVSVSYPDGKPYPLDGTVGTVNENGTVNSKWNCLNSLPNGTYKMRIKDNATGESATATFAVDFPSVSPGSLPPSARSGIPARVAWTDDGAGSSFHHLVPDRGRHVGACGVYEARHSASGAKLLMAPTDREAAPCGN